MGSDLDIEKIEMRSAAQCQLDFSLKFSIAASSPVNSPKFHITML